MAHPNLDETTYFRYVRTLDGKLEPIDLVKRNGRCVPRFSPSITGVPIGSPESIPIWEQERFFVNLNSRERRTWREILRGRSIADIALTHNVSRQAIYAQIRGNSKDQGGMIAKNFWVLLWWRLRQKLFSKETYV